VSFYQAFGRECDETYSAVSFAAAGMHRAVSATRPEN